MVRYVRTIEDLIDTDFALLSKMTLKRYRLLKPILEQVVAKETSRFFNYVGDKAIRTRANPFSFYSTGPWLELSDAYYKRKRREGRSTAFWSYKGLLENWLRRADPIRVYGEPYIDIQGYNPSARGYQRMVLTVDPFPRRNISLPKEIFYRLYGRRNTSELSESLRSYESNEESRPIIAPAMAQLINYSIKRKVVKTIREVLSNG